MKRFFPVLLVLLLTSLCGSGLSLADDSGFESIFDGKTLKGWDGNPKFWSVEDGAITGQTTKDNPTKGNTFIIWRGGEVGDFELKAEYRIMNHNSGIQYRSFEVPNNKWVVGGYQADIEGGDTWSGTNYGEKFRGILAKRGDKTVIGKDHKPKVVGKVGDTKELQSKIKKEDWNEYHIIANGFNFVQKINGVVMSEVTDEDAEQRRASGILALQLHAGPPMKVQFRNIRVKRTGAKKAASKKAASGKRKKVVFVAGNKSHGYGSHEHNAGCIYLAKSLNRAMPEIETSVQLNGWPKDQSVFEGADSVVMYCDGGGRHMVNPHLESFDKLMKKGVGVVCIHYAVEVPKSPSGEKFLDWLGGYFEAHWSVNPHWTAKFSKFPDHPISRGVKPFEINDEWYFHMRFRPDMEGVTPILSAVAPASTMTRPDGAHSGNPAARAAVAKKLPQHVAWATERKDGGRGFGFTGGHVHWNWGDDNFRKVVLNAIAWTAHAEVPDGGVSTQTPDRKVLEENQDYPKPGEKKKAKPLSAAKISGKVKPLFASKTVTKQTPGHAVAIDVDITGSKQLYLVVTDGGNGYACDWADWAEPRLVGPAGEKKLTDLKWKQASASWGKVQVNKNAGGGSLKIAGKSVDYGIGVHATSVIAFDVPAGYSKFQARGGLDNGGTDQAGGGGSSVQFLVFNKKPALVQVQTSRPADQGSREAADALAGLDVGEGLAAKVFAAEPQLLSPSNTDIDHRGRVWVCEIVNYRKHNGKRPEGDRILILEDTDGDGKADKEKVFYQGRDIDSPHGICVLGGRVIVSAGDKVFVFTDADGDDKPEKKEVLFSGISGTQHDHGIHAFTFGPDGKLYFNFGNSGRQIKDRDGKPIIDVAGNEVTANRKPYQEGMAFRCNLDGSEFETLGWNFRNNWMVTVDSFGSVWQSDNDDDGNKGVRINYVMEFGNYGYKDEFSGAGWKTPRTGMHSEVPLRHWHLRDPGVVPNVLQTGAGSPTGITVYEGSLLPKLHGHLLHCDAGPNVCRAYILSDDGAGYSAEISDVLTGSRDRWYRPSDVKVAPDGSLIIADWYDPGVGGHNMGDLTRGRLFRVLPEGHAGSYKVPKFDFESIDGAIEALKNPNYAVRYLAWTALHKQGRAAEPALVKLYESENSRYTARALWLLGKIEGRGQHYVDLAISDKDPDIRTVGIRLARQLKLDVIPIAKKLVKDRSPRVRREVAVALRHNESSETASLWAQLASQHDGKDRWYLEALGIAADGQWDACLESWLASVGEKWNTPAGRDIVWRSRAKKTPDYLRQIISEPSTSAAALPRYFRAFDFLEGDTKDQALIALSFDKVKGGAQREKAIGSESVARLGNVDITSNSKYGEALNRVLDGQKGTKQYIDLISKFNSQRRYPDLLAMAQAKPDDQLGVDAIRVLLAKKAYDLINKALQDKDSKVVVSTMQALGNSAENRAADLLTPMVKDKELDFELRRQATRSLAKTYNGCVRLIKMAQANELEEGLRAAAAVPLRTAQWANVRQFAAKTFPLPAAKDNKPLPSLSVLMGMKGDDLRGLVVFQKTGTCAKCHIVDGKGKEVGPDLSGIGKKLSKQAMFESVLYPSAGISHNYENYSIVLDSGNIISGIITSRTDDSITVKAVDALVRTYKTSEIEEIKKQTVSLMPADLQKVLTAQDLADVVAYMRTLNKVAPKSK